MILALIARWLQSRSSSWEIKSSLQEVLDTCYVLPCQKSDQVEKDRRKMDYTAATSELAGLPFSVLLRVQKRLRGLNSLFPSLLASTGKTRHTTHAWTNHLHSLGIHLVRSKNQFRQLHELLLWGTDSREDASLMPIILTSSSLGFTIIHSTYLHNLQLTFPFTSIKQPHSTNFYFEWILALVLVNNSLKKKTATNTDLLPQYTFIVLV